MLLLSSVKQFNQIIVLVTNGIPYRVNKFKQPLMFIWILMMIKKILAVIFFFQKMQRVFLKLLLLHYYYQVKLLFFMSANHILYDYSKF